jgi:hypothetical protein
MYYVDLVIGISYIYIILYDVLIALPLVVKEL